jgi:hypothetical protein
VTEARLESVPVDPAEARVFVAQAKVFLRDGQSGAVADPSRQVLLHNAAIAASDGILLAAGWRVTPGDGSHVLRLEKAVELLGGGADLADRLDDARLARNDASYGASIPSVDDVEAAVDVTEELVTLADAYVIEAGA